MTKKIGGGEIADDDNATHPAWCAAAIVCRGEVGEAASASDEARAKNRAREKELAGAPRRGRKKPCEQETVVACELDDVLN
jgi:hypothetical protein